MQLAIAGWPIAGRHSETQLDRIIKQAIEAARKSLEALCGIQQ